MSTPSSASNPARDAVVAAYRAHLTAMVEVNTAAPDDLLADEFTLTHITGYAQPKAEWLAQMGNGQFDYHHVNERELSVEIHGDTARLVGHIVTDATVYGSRAHWRLRLTMDYTRNADSWSATRSVATTW